MFTRRDRVELSVLGLLVLGWALVFAPVLHALAHAHGHTHQHGAPSSTPVPHGAGSVEHQRALFVDAAPAPVLLAAWQPLDVARPPEPDAPFTAARLLPEQPQGP